MTRLRQMMLEELQPRNYADKTIDHYIRWAEQYARFFGKPPDKLGPEHLRTYQAYLLKTRRLAPATVENHVSALRFFYVRTLRRVPGAYSVSRVRRQLPGILSREEVAQMINAAGTPVPPDAADGSVRHGYAPGGSRAAQAGRHRQPAQDNRVVNGKGGKDRDLPMSPALPRVAPQVGYWLTRYAYTNPPLLCVGGTTVK